MHLSHDAQSDGFVKRDRADGGLLLFAIFDDTAAYLLDVMPHGHWAEQHLVEVAVRSWPERRLFVPLNGVLGLGTAVTAADRTAYRSSGITAQVEIDSAVYWAPSISSAGTSNKAAMRAQRVLNILKFLDEQMANEPNYLRPHVVQSGKQYPATPIFRLALCSGPTGYGFAVQEEETGVLIPLAC